ncbi:MFS transporter [Geomonas nitrogeniifigens]|uniref:MFS transporter n=1 Tax=Geomonas diazotrophica TaxID=2843197 RepID=A0ABX8JIL7_9BACT|nr:MFS transporter [Geomonas nitrogeniifigens]QWV98240.1 MFS transporter [Geomonas nitrogeniifigens]QXE87424.1 MFS transporter [Geomonas nitrogeniifigens]
MGNLSNNIRKLYLFSFLQMTLFPMAIITLFWKDHAGLSLTQILLLQSIFSVATLALDYPAGYVSDRLGYRCALNIASILGMIGWGIYIWADSFTTVLLAEITLGMSLSFISGSDSALLFETLRAQGEEQSYARHQGRMHGFAQAGEAAGAVLAGVIYAWQPRLPFILQVAVWGAGLLVTRHLVETPRGHAPVRSHLAEALATARYAFLDNRHLRYTILLNTVLGVASFYPVWLIQPYMQHAGVPVAWFGPVWAGANLTVALCALGSHRLHNRLGDRGMVLLFLFLVVLGYLGLGLAGGIWGFLFYYLLTCMRGLRGPMMLAHTQRESSSANRAATLSLQSVSFRLLFVATGPLVGKLADQAGVGRCFYLLFYAFVATLPLLAVLFLRHAPRRLHSPTP